MAEYFEAENGKSLQLNDDGFISGLVNVKLNDLINGDFDSALDLFSEKLIGDESLSDISCDLVGVHQGEIVLKITGNVTEILASRLENSPSP